ncbi:MAG: NosD domain-containing protein [Candidatus Lokiarchaeia archaeon]
MTSRKKILIPIIASLLILTAAIPIALSHSQAQNQQQQLIHSLSISAMLNPQASESHITSKSPEVGSHLITVTYYQAYIYNDHDPEPDDPGEWYFQLHWYTESGWTSTAGVGPYERDGPGTVDFADRTHSWYISEGTSVLLTAAEFDESLLDYQSRPSVSIDFPGVEVNTCHNATKLSGDVLHYYKYIIYNEAPVVQNISVSDITLFSVNFSCSVYDPEGDSIIAYEWDFGDGTNSTEANPHHEYTKRGTYNVSLRVQDSLGTWCSYEYQTIKIPKLIEVTWTNPTITGLNVSKDLYITLNGNLTITETGELHLINCILNVNNGTTPVQYGIKVYGEIYINESSTITAINPANPYYFTVYEGAAFQMNNSRVEYCGHINGEYPNEQGLTIRADNVWIENNVITHGCHGLILYGSQDSSIINNTINNNHRGLYLLYIQNNNISGNIANNNDYGFVLYSSSYNTLLGNTATNNRIHGFALWSESKNNILTNNTAQNNEWYGFALQDRSNNNTLSDNTATNNGREGFWLISCSYNLLWGNTALNNRCGFYLQLSSHNNISGNTAINNYEHGFYIYRDSNHNFIGNNNATGNGQGFYLDNCYNNTLSGNIALNCTIGYNWTSSSVDNDFTGSLWMNYLCIKITDALDIPIPSVDVKIETDGKVVYATPWFGGSDPTTDPDGVIPWITILYRTGTGIDTMVENLTTVSVYYQDLFIEDNPRKVNMSKSHLEIFKVDNINPIVVITVPANDTTVNSGIIWINGTFDGTGSNVMNITIDDARFTLVEPSGLPYGISGTFGFMASDIETSEFDVEIFIEDEAGNNETVTRHVIVDQDKPLITIDFPIPGIEVVTTGVVWINGTFDGTGSQVTSITINDSRFTLVEPIGAGPYDVTGIYSFMASTIVSGEYSITILVQDEAGHTETAIRQFSVVEAQEPYTPVTWTNPTIDGYSYVARNLNITLKGKFIITATGELHLINCILNVNNGTRIQYGISVQGGLYINSSSTITAINPANPYYFVVDSGARFQMNDSRVEYCGHKSGFWPNYYGLIVKAKNAWIENNTITHCEIGLILYRSRNSTILNNTVTSNAHGIELFYGSYNNLSGNIVSNNRGYGFRVEDSQNNNILGNTVNNNHIGFMIWTSSNNIISGNNASDNNYGYYLWDRSNNNLLYNNTAKNTRYWGYYLYSSSNNNLSDNIATNNNYGFYLYSSSYNFLSDNNATNNDISFYLEYGLSNLLLNNIAIDSMYEGFYLQSSSNNNLSGNTATNNDLGFRLYSSSNSLIIGNTASNNAYGFYLYSSSNNNTLSGNNATNNDFGFYLLDSSSNFLSDNIATDNNNHGFYLNSSSYSNVSGNSASNNAYGFYLYSSSDCILSDNNATNNIYDGFYLESSSYSNLTGNNAVNNSRYGFYLRLSSYSNVSGHSASNNAYGFYLYSSSDCILSDNNATNNKFYGFILQDKSNNNNLSGNNAINNRDGFWLITHCSNNLISDNNATNNSRYGFYLQLSSYNNLSGNTASNNAYGFYLYSSSNNNLLSGNNATNNNFGFCLRESSNNILSTNMATNNTQFEQYGFCLWSSSNNLLSSNDAINNFYGFYLYSNSNNNNLSDNTATNNYIGFYLYSCSYNTLSSNNASDNKYGFDLYYSSNNTLEGNTAINNDEIGYGLGASSHNLLLSNIATNNRHGFYLGESSNNILSNNTATNNDDYGFHIFSSSNNNTLSGNNAMKHLIGFRSESSHYNNFSDNTAIDNNVGFYPWSSSHNIFSGNTATNNDYGFYMYYSSHNNLSGNTITHSSYEGFRMSHSSYNILSGNTVSSNEEWGFLIYSSSHNNFSGNIVKSNDAGFYLSGSSYNNLTNNTAQYNRAYGFFLGGGSYNLISGNSAIINYNWGFYLSGSSYNLISDNIATRNNYGFYLRGSPNNNLFGNNATNNDDYGFYLHSSSYNNLTGNNAIKTIYYGFNKNFGFYLSSNSNNNILSGNTAINNRYGFRLDYSINNTLSGNTATDKDFGFYLYYSNDSTLIDNTAIVNNYGFNLQSSSNNTLFGNTALNCSTGYNWTSDSVNNDFTGSVWVNHLCVKVTDLMGFPISGADIKVVTDGTLVYATPWFGGSDPTTDSNGLTLWITVNYRTGTGIDTMTENITTVTVYYQGWFMENNPRTVNTSTSHIETFQADNIDPIVVITVPANDITVNTGTIWINGTYNGTGSNVTDISCNDTRFSLQTSPPFGLTGIYSFVNNTPIATGDFWVQVTVTDQSSLTGIAQRLVIVDQDNPTITIIVPPDDNTVNTGVVWINGTFDGTGSNVMSITVNDTRFTLVEPSGPPYGVTGTYSFMSSVTIATSGFDVEVIIEDQAGLTEKATRHVIVDQTNPDVAITIPPSDGTVYTGTVWINGTFDGTGSQVTNIAINDSRFTLVEPVDAGPYSVTGTYSFKALIIGEGEFGFEVTVWDQAGLTGTATRHLIFVNNTPTGEDVEVTDPVSGINMTFDNVTDSGTTTVTAIETGPEPPEGFVIIPSVTGDVYYDINTTANYTGTITIAIPYDETQLTYPWQESFLKLYHWNSTTEEWEDVTTWVDTENNIIYGEITSFSIFTVMEPLDVTPPTTTVSLSGTLGLGDWYISDVTVTLTATDDITGVALTEYSFDGETWNTFTVPFTVTHKGITTVYYRSTDKVGNVEDTNSVEVKIYIESQIDIDPDTLNLKSKGKWITAYITLPEGYDVNDIDVSSIILRYGDESLTAAWGKVQDGTLMVKFDRASLIDLLGDVGDNTEIDLQIWGEVAGMVFAGSDTIRVISRGK